MFNYRKHEMNQKNQVYAECIKFKIKLLLNWLNGYIIYRINEQRWSLYRWYADWFLLGCVKW